MDASVPLVELRSVTKRYGGLVALDKVSAAVGRGEHVAIVGGNGAGKSTLVKILSGTIRLDGGEFLIRGVATSFRSPFDARMAGIETVYQDLALVEHLDVTANMFLGREELAVRLGPLSVLARRRMKTRAREILNSTGVRIHDLDTEVLALSGGQRQGIAIARAAGWGSSLIILDEPTAALGVQETARVEETIRALRAQGVAVLIVSHSLRQVFDLVDRLWIMRHGSLVADVGRADVTIEEVSALLST